METKEKIKVLLDLDDDGYIIGYQQEFYDGKAWQTPFDTMNAVELSPDSLAGVALGATKLVNGALVVDTEHQKAIEAQDAANAPIDYEAKIAELEAKLDAANQATLELADMMLGGDSNDASAS
jgi:hypothetical protein